MIVVIIAGGSGSRLWPLSTPDYPKHLLTIGDQKLSLMQQTYKRARSLTDKIYVASEISHIDQVKQQLPDLPETAFIVEPGRRGTANCIMAALVQIEKENPSDEPIIFMAADHYIQDVDGFVASFKLAAETAQQQKRLVLIGIEPDYPAIGFGYIEKGETLSSNVCNVNSFREKPDQATAEQYLKSGQYLWNAGYFVGSVDTFKHVLESYAPVMLDHYQQLSTTTTDSFAETYLAFESISIDYAVIEKVQGLLVVPASFDWMDLGSFGDLHKAVSSDETGNHVKGPAVLEDVQNTYVDNQEDKPVILIGLDNLAVINTPHGILITHKDQSQKVGDATKRL